MELRFREIVASDVDRLAGWMTGQTWPYHSLVKVDASWVRERAASEYFFGDTTRSFWALADDGATIVGLARVFDLADVTPLVDLRIGDDSRGQGAGTALLRWLTQWVFDSHPATHRLGGYTRHDNHAMRRVFEKCHFTQEAHHRQAWRIDANRFADAVGYAILRADWHG
ncbi:hypothetical protein AYO49_00230 [Verrucomicrobiaceae bacterium SCGC AG-212-N21]|nr:hypothetical protein AYO49_00230 [Verrucomicrobiaceae bacterium SCGC AG-212-N21]